MFVDSLGCSAAGDMPLPAQACSKKVAFMAHVMPPGDGGTTRGKSGNPERVNWPASLLCFALEIRCGNRPGSWKAFIFPPCQLAVPAANLTASISTSPTNTMQPRKVFPAPWRPGPRRGTRNPEDGSCRGRSRVFRAWACMNCCGERSGNATPLIQEEGGSLLCQVGGPRDRPSY